MTSTTACSGRPDCCCRRWSCGRNWSWRHGCGRAPGRPYSSTRRRTTSPVTRTELLGAVRACDVFLPSEVEAVTLAGTADLDAAAAAFLALGPHTVVIKLAAAGCLMATRDRPGPVRMPTVVFEPVDSTGAGDAFCGGFAAEYLRSGDVMAAAAVGGAAAGVAVSGAGIAALVAAGTAVGTAPPATEPANQPAAQGIPG